MLKYLFLIVAICAAAYAGFQYLQSSDIPRVSTVNPDRGPIKNVINLTGRVINDRTVTLSALVNGQITDMKIAKGQLVQSGQILAHFDRREADAELERLQAERELADEKLKLTRSSLDRLINIGPNGSVSQQQLDDAQTEWRIASAQLKVSEAAYRIAVIQREKYDVMAPFDGVITEKTTEVGQWVEAGTPLFTLVARQGREIEMSIDSSDRGQIKLDQLARLSVDAWPDIHWEERVHWLAPAVSESDAETLNTFNARVTLGDNAPPLILGQQVDVELVIESKNDVLRLPYSVLIENADSRQIAIIDNDSTIKLTDLDTGIEDIRYIEVLNGDIDIDTVIAKPGDRPYSTGQQVSVNRP